MKKTILLLGAALFLFTTKAHGAITLSKDFNAAPLGQGVFSTACVTSQNPLDPTNNVGYLTNEYSTDGGMSFKAQARKTDPICGNSHRTEMHLSTTNPIMQNAEWIAWDTYQPVDQPNDPVPYVTGQIHGAVIVPFGLWFFDGTRVWAVVQSRVDGVNMVQTKFDLGNIGTKGVWHKWILHFKRATDNTGLVELWVDGVKKVTFNGPNMDLNETQFYFKFGIYKWSILNSIYDSAVAYTDNLKFGDRNATIDDFLVVPDSTIPTGTLTAPLTGTTVNGATTVSANATDNVAVASVNFFYGTTLIASDTSAPYSTPWNTLAVPNGTYQLKAIISDTTGNTNSTQIVTVTVNNPDTVAPVVAITSPINTATVFGTASTITATASDAMGVVGVDFYQGTTLISTDTVAPYVATWNTTSVPNGAYTLKAIARDAAGNSSAPSTITVQVLNPDITPPAGVLTSPSNGAVLTGTTTVAASASDNVGVASVNFFYGTTLIGIDTSAPYTATWNTTLVADGVYAVKAIIIDTSANNNSTQVVSVTVSNPDTTAPIVSISSPSNGAGVSGNPSIVATATDAVGVTSVDFYYDSTLIGSDTTLPYFVAWDTRTVANGTYTLKAIARDAAGNTTTSAFVTVSVLNSDITAPTVSLTSPTTGTTVSGATASLAANASDNSAVSKVEFYYGTTLIGTDTTAPYTAVWNTTTVANGTYLLKAIAYDASNNTAQSTQVSVTVSNVVSGDTVVPTGTLTAPAVGAMVSGTTTVSANASDNVAVASVNFFYGTTLIGIDSTAPYALPWNTTTIANGAYPVKAIIVDTSGNTNSTQIAVVTVFNSAGSITTAIVTPITGVTVYGTIALTATAAGTAPITKVEFYKDSDTLPFAVVASAYTTFFDTRTVANGVHTFKVVAYDINGASGTSTPISIRTSN